MVFLCFSTVKINSYSTFKCIVHVDKYIDRRMEWRHVYVRQLEIHRNVLQLIEVDYNSGQ